MENRRDRLDGSAASETDDFADWSPGDEPHTRVNSQLTN